MWPMAWGQSNYQDTYEKVWDEHGYKFASDAGTIQESMWLTIQIIKAYFDRAKKRSIAETTSTWLN